MFFRLLLCILFPLYLFSDTILSEEKNRYDKFTISYLYDEESQLQIEDVLIQDFKDTSNQFGFGYMEGTTWFKLTLTNASESSDYILQFTEVLWNEFNLYRQDNQTWKDSKAGLLIPLDKREINNISPAFKLHVPTDQTQTFYIQGKSVSSQLGAFQIFTQEEYFRPTRFDLTELFLFYIMFLFIIALFNIYLYIAQREKIYAFYITYVLLFAVWLSVFSGVYLSFGFSGWDHGLHVSGTWVLLLLVLFSSEYMELKERLPNIYKIFNLFALIFLLFGPAIELEVPFASLIFNITASIFFAFLLFVAIKVLREGHIKMQYYLLALIFYMPTMGMMTLVFNGFADNTDLFRYAFIFGSFVEVLFFNSLMVSRYHSLFNDKIHIQNELIKEKEKNEVVLEDEIKERIEELEQSNEKLVEQAKELEVTKAKLAVQTTTDPLSQLYNRRYITQVAIRNFEAALRYKSDLSVIMIDLDDFKKINDNYGHAVGDEVIVRCADILKKLVRSSDILARFGGEEFIAVIPHTPAHEVLALADRIRENIEKEAIKTSNEELHFTLSIGIAHLQKEDINVDQMILRAEKSLYLAKSKGKNRIEAIEA